MFYQTRTACRPPKGPKNAAVCPWWPWSLTFKLVRASDQTRLPCEFDINPFSSSGDISYTNKKKTTDWQHQKQNLPQITVFGKNQYIAFSALTLSVGWQEEHPAWKNGGWWRWALLRTEWRPAGQSVCLPLLIFPCTIKCRSSLLAPAHPGGPGKRVVKRFCVCVCKKMVDPTITIKVNSCKPKYGVLLWAF